MKATGVNIIGGGMGWQKILSQEGIPIYKESDIWIVNEKTNGLLDFVKNGGAVLTTTHPLQGRIKEKGKRKKGGLGYTEEEIGKGSLIVLAFNPDIVFEDRRTKRRCFYSDYGRFPDERVSFIPHKEIRNIVVGCLKRLFAKKGIPYIHSWYYPKGRSLFALRVDTDFTSAERVISLEKALSEIGIKASFFLNTKALEKDIEKILSFNHIFGVHCYNHKVYPDKKRNYENIKKAKGLIERNGKKVSGFASPYGMWNMALYSAMKGLGFSYSSEFSLAYDDLPFFPEDNGPLQIPAHPICPQRLFMSRHTREDVKKYYLSLIDRNLKSGEPTIIYAHPDALLQNLDIIKEIFDYVKDKDIWVTDTDEIDKWWRERAEGVREQGRGGVREQGSEGVREQGMRDEIVLPDGRWAICSAEEKTNLKDIKFNPPRTYTYKTVRENPLWLFLREVEARLYRFRSAPPWRGLQ